MKTTLTNAGLLTVGTGLITLGATTIGTELWTGVIEVALGLAIYIVYEVLP